MSKYLATLNKLVRDEKGVTALEYGLIAALIAVAIIGAVSTLGNSLSAEFGYVSSKFSSTGVAH